MGEKLLFFPLPFSRAAGVSRTHRLSPPTAVTTDLRDAGDRVQRQKHFRRQTRGHFLHISPSCLLSGRATGRAEGPRSPAASYLALSPPTKAHFSNTPPNNQIPFQGEENNPGLGAKRSSSWEKRQGHLSTESTLGTDADKGSGVTSGQR